MMCVCSDPAAAGRPGCSCAEAKYQVTPASSSSAKAGWKDVIQAKTGSRTDTGVCFVVEAPSRDAMVCTAVLVYAEWLG